METIQSLQKKLEKNTKRASKLYTEAQAIRSLLKGICDHSKTHDYRWEWDSGYGRQKQKVGKCCVYCGWVDLWNSGRFTDPANIDY